MKFRILFDNYYFFLLLYCVIFIFSYFVLNVKLSYAMFLILGGLCISDILFEKKRYLLNLEINETDLEITYLNSFFKKKQILARRELIHDLQYLKKKSIFNTSDIVQITKKESSEILKFKIFEDKIKEDVQNKLR